MTNKIIVLIVFSCLLWSDVAGQGFMKSYDIDGTDTNHGVDLLDYSAGYLIATLPISSTTGAPSTGLVKTNSLGVKQGDNLFENGGRLFAITPTIKEITDSGWIIAGEMGHLENYGSLFLLRISEHGDSLLLKEYGEADLRHGSIHMAIKDDTVLVAVRYGDFSNTYANVRLLKLDTCLSLLNEIPIQGISGYVLNWATFINIDQTNNFLYFTIGHRYYLGAPTYMNVQKTTLSGTTVWSYALPGYTTATNTPTQIGVLPNGNIVTHWFDEGNGGSPNELNPYLICLSPNDSLVWRYDFNDDEYGKFPVAISVAANGDIIGCGYTHRPDYDYDCGWLFRVSSEGELLWEREYIGYTAAVNFLLLEGIDEDTDGNIVATGMVVDPTPIGGYEGNALLLKVLPNGCFTPDCAGGGEDTLIVASTVLGVESAPKPSSGNSVFSLLLYPNPATDVVSLLLPTAYLYNNRSAAVVVCDLSGRVLRRFDLGSGGGTSGSLVAIPTHDLVNGMYVVQYIEAGRVKGVGKMVVLR